MEFFSGCEFPVCIFWITLPMLIEIVLLSEIDPAQDNTSIAHTYSERQHRDDRTAILKEPRDVVMGSKAPIDFIYRIPASDFASLRAMTGIVKPT